MHDELVDEVAQRRSRPGHEALAAEEPAASLTANERVAIVELGQEFDALLDLFARGKQLEPGARELAGQGPHAIDHPGEHGLDDLGEGRHGVAANVSRNVLVDVDRAAERDDALHTLAAHVGRRLIGEHSALRIPHDVHVATFEGAHSGDALGDGFHVVGQVSPQTVLGLFRSAEVDQVGRDLGATERGHRREVLLDVVDLGGHHERRDQEDRDSPRIGVGGVAAEFVVGPFVNDLVRGAVFRTELPDARELERVSRGLNGALRETTEYGHGRILPQCVVRSARRRAWPISAAAPRATWADFRTNSSSCGRGRRPSMRAS